MPTIIVRPHTNWPETTVSDDNETAFWLRVDAYWAATMQEMGEVENRTGEPQIRSSSLM